jgi:hypothetical protein
MPYTLFESFGMERYRPKETTYVMKGDGRKPENKKGRFNQDLQLGLG